MVHSAGPSNVRLPGHKPGVFRKMPSRSSSFAAAPLHRRPSGSDNAARPRLRVEPSYRPGRAVKPLPSGSDSPPSRPPTLLRPQVSTPCRAQQKTPPSRRGSMRLSCEPDSRGAAATNVTAGSGGGRSVSITSPFSSPPHPAMPLEGRGRQGCWFSVFERSPVRWPRGRRFPRRASESGPASGRRAG